MLEALIVLAAVGLLGGMGVVVVAVPAEWVVAAGFAGVAAGLALGVPTGFWYHVRLRQALVRRGALPPRWWLRPVNLHPRLREDERPDVLPWFWAGGLGFAVSLAGCLTVIAGVVLQAFRAGLL